MSQDVKTPPASAPAEASNRVALGLSNRLLARPEIGALVAAVVIFIFFLVVAPAFRSPASFFTVLYQSSTIGIVAVGVGHADDRRRVRPVRRRHRRSRPAWSTRCSAASSASTCGSARSLSLVFCLLVGLPQRLPRDADGDPELPDHARHLLHPAGREPRRDEAGDRLGVDAEHLPDGRLRLAAARSSPPASRSARSPSGAP